MPRFRCLILTTMLVAFWTATAWAQAGEDEWVDLFNGKDLTGWETWLSRAPGERSILGLNNDPLNVFTVEEGLLYLSGQVFGALTTIDEYEDFHLLVEFKWGEKKWPPRHNQARDGGISYYATGPHGVFAGSFMKSNQFQLQEGGTGDFWSVAGTIADVEAKRDGEDWRYAPGGAKTTISKGRVVASSHPEHPVGEWNTVEIIAKGDSIRHVVNGETVLVLTDPRHLVDGSEQPLRRGKFQIQSEGADLWVRTVRIKTPLE